MGFKVDSSFLKFVTMGAVGGRAVAIELENLGFSPIELERYSQSNKIWATKVKRLRLPDLLCVRTGLRIEVRAKSNLSIKMSDAPDNPDRTWDAGLRDNDVIALVACSNEPDGPAPSPNAVYFPVDTLRQSVGTSKLGAPKSASEGAERDRTWPCTVPSRPGRVLTVTATKLVVEQQVDGGRTRNQTYTLNGKHPYVSPGNRFVADATILAGTPHHLADLKSFLLKKYDPLADLTSANKLDRYAAVKAIRYREDLASKGLSLVEQLLRTEPEVRIALEAAGTAAAMGSGHGEALIETILAGDAVDMSMEAIFVLTELKTKFARDLLIRVASENNFVGDERRQAALWGLGKTGHRAYGNLVPYIADEEENVALHAVAGFGNDTPIEVIKQIIPLLISGEQRQASAASETLRHIGGRDVFKCLIEVIDGQSDKAVWALTTLGRLDPALVRSELGGSPVLDLVEPLLNLTPGVNWLVNENTASSLAFLHKQSLG